MVGHEDRGTGVSPGPDTPADTTPRKIAPRKVTLTAEAAAAHIERIVRRTRLLLAWESIWPILAWILIIAAVFVGLSWLGLWLVIWPIVRYGLLALFAGAVIWALWPLSGFRLASREDCFRRIEELGGYRHQPLTALNDPLAAGAADLGSRILWDAHRQRVLRSIAALQSGWARSNFNRRDPWAARVVAAMILIAGFAVGGDRVGQLKSAFATQVPSSTVTGRIDAWIAPPSYTRRPPVLLTVNADGDQASQPLIRVPEQSLLVVRVQDHPDIQVVLQQDAGETALQPVDDEQDGSGSARPRAKNAAKSLAQYRQSISTDTTVIIRSGTRELRRWLLAVDPDNNPSIAFVEPPSEAHSGSFKVVYEMDDDYAIVSATAKITANSDRQSGMPTSRPPQPLFDPPSFALTLPSGNKRTGRSQTFRDLTAHPWAGSSVDLTLSATDEAGQTGNSKTVTVTLPSRRFHKPIARAIVEQRRILALDANRHIDVIEAIDGLLIAPHIFTDNAGQFLALRHAYRHLTDAGTDDELRQVVATFWDLALSFEDGDLSLAERALRDAQEALRRALEGNASDEEIQRLTQQLREALNRFLQALAEQAQRRPQAELSPDQQNQMLSRQDLNKLLDRIEELARMGSRDAARQMLSQLRQMLENLRTGRMQNDPNGRMSQMLRELGEMIRRQQKLMDQTHRLGRPGRNDPNSPQSGEERAKREQEFGRLQRGQGDLRGALEKYLKDLRENGMRPGQQFGKAGEAMEGAEGELGRGRPGAAVGNQGKALEALREGANAMVQQLLGMGRNGRTGPNPRARNQDPLGRPRQTQGPDLGLTVKVPDEIDAQRARRILNELRRRLSDPSRPPPEIDYLERLLKRY
jgi:uncharacterized protein (TIGR02302 family)